MKKIVAGLGITLSLLLGGDYDFDFDKIEVKPYEYSGFLRNEYRYTKLPDDKQSDFIHEALLNFSYFKDIYRLNSSFSNNLEENSINTYELYLNIKPNANHTFDIGKKTLRWGKGYFYNPVAFFERPKDPLQPELTREGFVMGDYTYNKSLDGNIKNIAVNLVYLPTSSELNPEYEARDNNRLALRLYTLLYDTDIDLIYLYNEKGEDTIGLDFSKNLLPHFEIHGEYAKEIDGYEAYLLGLKYVTETDITITSEYFKDGILDREMFVNKFLKKEPFEIVYASGYFKDMYNISQSSHLDSLGFIYDFKNNIQIDFSYNHYFENPKAENFVWMKVNWYF